MTPPPYGQVLQVASTWIRSGMSLIPIKAAKKPSIEEWTPYKATAPTLDQAQQWWGNGRILGYAIICGQVSGNLEMTELEAAAMTEEAQSRLFDVMDRYADAGSYEVYAELWHGYRQQSPTGGIHLAYRISDHLVPGNEKIARRPATEAELEARPGNRFVVLAETRGEGGYFIGAGSPGLCHPSGKPWELHHGEIGSVPTITWEQRQLWHTILREALDEMPAEPAVSPRPATPPAPPRDGLSPGDDFEQQVSWAEILEPHGWQIESVRRNTTNWTRPGKSTRDGMSATTGHSSDRDRLYVFSSSTAFQAEKSYTKFAAYTVLNHGGETSAAFQAATRELARQGYGTRLDFDGPRTFMGEPVTDAPSTDVAVVDETDETPHFRWDDLGATRRLWSRLRGRSRYVVERKDYIAFDGKRWVEDPRGGSVHREFDEIAEMYARRADRSGDEKTRTWARKLASTRMANSCVTRMAHQEGATVYDRDLDANRDLINVHNGVLNPSTGELQPHAPEFLMTRMFGTSYEPTATAPTWEKYISDVLPDPEMREYVRRAAGYTLLAKPNRRSIFFIYGGARTGKSTFLETMRDLFGEYGKSVSPATFEEKRGRGGEGATPSLNSMRGKRFVGSSETTSDGKFDEGLLKRLSGGDTIESRELYERSVEWRPDCVPWLATNFAPTFSASDDAIWERTKLIPFTQKFTGDCDDPDLKDKLRAEFPGILNWILQGVRDFLANGLGEPPSIAEEVQQHRESVDPVTEFIQDMVQGDRLTVAEDAKIRTQDLYQMYADWCLLLRHRIMGTRSFLKRMSTIMDSSPVKSNGLMYWKGIGVAGGWITGAG